MGTGTQIKNQLDALMPSSNQEKALEVSVNQYDHITLTDEESNEALRLAREQKHYLQRRIDYAQELSRKRELLTYSAEELFKFYSQQFDVDDDNRNIVKNLCCYFTDDKRFKGDLEKGLLLFGGVGVGKTELMNFFKRNQKASYRVMSCREIESDFSSEGEKSVRNCSYNIDITENAFGQSHIGFCFDDLGTEANAKHFGKEKNVMAEILLNRYQNVGLQFTHVTTNLTADEITEQYGSRVSDRFKEMFNIIIFPTEAKSRRK